MVRYTLKILQQILQDFNPLSANPQNGKRHSNNSLVVVDELFECVLRLALKGLHCV